jgi:serine/threonine protein kinase
MKPGDIIGSYRVEKKLGEGGMGVVFLAYDTTLHRQVALKVVADSAEGGVATGRLLREARNAAALNHPNICTVHEVRHDAGTTFIAMEYVEGRSLRERIDECGALPHDEALRYASQANAMAYATTLASMVPAGTVAATVDGQELDVRPRTGAARSTRV